MTIYPNRQAGLKTAGVCIPSRYLEQFEKGNFRIKGWCNEAHAENLSSKKKKKKHLTLSAFSFHFIIH